MRIKWKPIILFLVAIMSFQTVVAQFRPDMSIYVNWTPDQQLTSISGDTRYVNMDIYVDGNIQFWATAISCNVGTGTQLTFDSIDFGDDWGVENSDFTAVTANGQYYSTNGILAFSASRVGANNTPMGLNGANYTLLLASVRFQVNELGSNTSVAASCRIMNFLDRDGNLAIRARQTRLNDLKVLVGYTLTGTTLRQGSRTHTNIAVNCTHDPFGSPTVYGPVYSSLTGSFSFGGTSVLRDFGLYQCEFESKLDKSSENTAILRSQLYFSLDTPYQNIMPVVLRSGDFIRTGGGDTDIINFNDLIPLTAAFGLSGALPFTAGDTNGDGLRNDSDLAILAGNIAYADTPSPLSIDHVIYGLGRDFDTKEIFPNSKIWWGNSESGQVFELVSRSRTRDFWPQLSPDGSEIVYNSIDTRTGRYLLSFASISTRRGVTVRAPRDFTDEMLASSWSPDGNRIAFICTDSNSLQFNHGNICIVNRDDNSLATLYKLNVDSKIFPPAWLSNYGIVFANPNGDLYYVDITNGQQVVLPVDSSSGNTLDMPIIVDYIFDDNLYLSYRFSAGGNTTPHIRIGTIAYDGTSFTGGVTATLSASHVALSSATLGVDYYDVSPSLDVMFYHDYSYALANIAGNPYQFVSLYHIAASPLTWSSPVKHLPDGYIGNPITDEFGSIWNGNPNVRTLLHAQRATFDWVP